MEKDKVLSAPKALLIKSEGFGDGSGFFVKEDLIVTNIHVVAGATSVSAKLVDIQGNTIEKFIVEGVKAFDAKNDLVILKIVGKGTPLPIGDNVRNGDIVQVVGYPNRQYKVTKGPVHSVRSSDKWIRMKFKTDGGNSGGPVLNGNGEVVGVAIADADYFSFAIPVTVVKILLAQTQEVEPLTQWQEREPTRAYVCLVQSQGKHSKSLHSEAIDDLDKAIQLNPNCAFFYYSRGIVISQLGKLKTDDGDLANGHKHYRDAIVDYTKAIKLCPDYAVAYGNRGTAKADLGQSKSETTNGAETQQYYQDAIADYTKAIKLCPSYAISYDSRGVAKSYLGQFEVKKNNITRAQQYYQNAIDDHTEAIKLCPDYDSAYNNRADVKFHFGRSEDAIGNIEASQHLYKEAAIDINTAIKLARNVSLFYHTRGEIMHALGDYNAAIEDYEKAREIDPDYTDVCKDLELAKKALEQAKGGPTED